MRECFVVWILSRVGLPWPCGGSPSRTVLGASIRSECTDKSQDMSCGKKETINGGSSSLRYLRKTIFATADFSAKISGFPLQ
ncbi:hypothetical protein F4775DRAFT_543847 [Biscogniauxia sp. FL1348]|nr:hypothetical protein F4775DRAFT_543847 [Biscogniauxia sp. FL1348]